MTLHEVISRLSPGDKFIYKDQEYMMLKTTPADLCCSANMHNLMLAISINDYEIFAFDNTWEVEVLK
jgi:hypothetical protein